MDADALVPLGCISNHGIDYIGSTGPCTPWGRIFNTLRPRQNGRHFTDDIFKCIFLNENARILLKISLKCVPKVRINNILALVQIMAWRRPGDKPLSEPMMVSLLTHICLNELTTYTYTVKTFGLLLDQEFWSDFAHIKHDYTQEFYRSYSSFSHKYPRTG